MGALIDSFGRTIDYLRLSVTDRCDFRCVYCMAEEMQFAPRRDLLSFEELDRLSAAFIARGVRRLRITGGEPLARKGIVTLFRTLRRHLDSGALDEVTLTTNGSRLRAFAGELADCGVRRINVSIDTLDPSRFAAITRRDCLAEVLAGVAAATRAGIRVKINTVALKGVNEAELPALLRWCHAGGHDLTLIETMPLGEIGGDRLDQYLALDVVRDRLAGEFTLEEIADRTGGPARYVRVKETGGRLGFITPMSDNFCAGCNRVRVTCTGRLYPCLGQDEQIDLRAALRNSEGDDALNAAIATALARKPRGHDFIIAPPGEAPTLARYMSMTGG